MSNVVDIEDYFPHTVYFLVCLGCTKDWTGVARSDCKEIKCLYCESKNIKGVTINVDDIIYRGKS